MSTRTSLRPQTFTGNMASNITFPATILQSLTSGSYGLSWTGTSPVGTLSLQASDDYSLDGNGQVNNPGTWNTAPISIGGTTVTTIPISGNSDHGYIEILGTGAYALRLLYTAGSGTGTLTATVNGKVG